MVDYIRYLQLNKLIGCVSRTVCVVWPERPWLDTDQTILSLDNCLPVKGVEESALVQHDNEMVSFRSMHMKKCDVVSSGHATTFLSLLVVESR